MIAYISALILLGVALVAISLRKAYYFFPAKELKRQARGGDSTAAVLYKAVAYGGSMRLLLWIVIGLSIAGSFLLLLQIAPWWLVFGAVAGLVWYGFAWAPSAPVSGWGLKLVVLATPLVSWILYYLHPPLDKTYQFIMKYRPVTFHTGLFERDDLLELLEIQRQLPDNRISSDELELAIHALSFGDKRVQQVMVPSAHIKSVDEADVIGPILMDELYDSTYSRFPVRSGNDGEFKGVLHLRDLVAVKHGERVSEVMQSQVYYVHEDETLYHVLHAFDKTKNHVFIVLNNLEEPVGMISIEDVLQQMTGRSFDDDFESYDDKRSVAARGRKQSTVRHAGKPEPVSEELEDTEVPHEPIAG